MIPGLIDGHAHMDREGLTAVYPSLAGARSILDIQARIAALVRAARPGEWVVSIPLADPPAAIDPLVSALYPIPKIAILPLVMLFFGIGDLSKVVLVALSVIFLVLINTTAGVLALDPVYFDVAKNYGAPKRKLFLRVIIPGALPFIFVGLRLGIGVALIVIVAAEFVAARSGVGFLIWTSWEVMRIENMFVGIIAITILGLIFTLLLKELESWALPWRRHRM